jgi:hypothetical protein
MRPGRPCALSSRRPSVSPFAAVYVDARGLFYVLRDIALHLADFMTTAVDFLT